MKSIKIANYSIYSDGDYSSKEMNFAKLYKGVRVNACNFGGDPKYISFSIRTKKVKDTIWKRPFEKMNSLEFDNRTFTVYCDFENEPNNKSKHSLTFDKETYVELFENIPEYLNEIGVVFTVKKDFDSMILIF